MEATATSAYIQCRKSKHRFTGHDVEITRWIARSDYFYSVPNIRNVALVTDHFFSCSARSRITDRNTRQKRWKQFFLGGGVRLLSAGKGLGNTENIAITPFLPYLFPSMLNNLSYRLLISDHKHEDYIARSMRPYYYVKIYRRFEGTCYLNVEGNGVLLCFALRRKGQH